MMEISVRWLEEWVDIGPDVSVLAEDLTSAGLEVSAVKKINPLSSKIVVGQIVSVPASRHQKKSPRVSFVDVGRVRNIRVCSESPKIEKGTKVVVALPGSTLPSGEKVGRVTIRGEIFGGILCSAALIGLEESSDDIMELDETATVGQAVTDHLRLDDTVLDIEFTPNRGDCLSVLGVAREISAFRCKPIKRFDLKNRRSDTSSMIAMSVMSTEDAPRYVGRVIEGLNATRKTPDWIKERLRRSGLRSIGPIVDITNFVMLELGQPLHAFDLRFVNQGIVVRHANRGESLTLLDGTKIQLVPETTVIANQHGPVGLAGIMGGLQSGVDINTQAIFLESAYFRPGSIANSARKYGLQTDASYRFERGVDPLEQRRAVVRATELFQEICSGRSGPICDVSNKQYLPKKKGILLRRDRLKRILGVQVPEKTVQRILSGLNMSPAKHNEGWKVRPPLYRFDIEAEHDLVEEVARLYGFINIPSRAPHTTASRGLGREVEMPVDRFQDYLVDRDYTEVITYSFVDSDLQDRVDPNVPGVELRNPIASNMNVMRTTLWPGLLQAVDINQRRQVRRIRLFEFGHVFSRKGTKTIETQRLGGVACGSPNRLHWSDGNKAIDFFDMKGDLEGLLGLDGRDISYQFLPAKHPSLHPGQSAQICSGSKPIGYVGCLHPEIQQFLDFDFPVYMFEIDLVEISQRSIPIYQRVSRFPFVHRDLSIVISDEIPAVKIEKVMRTAGGRLLTSIRLFDVYVGKEIEKDCKSLSFGLTLQSSSRNLTDKEVEAVLGRIVTALQKLGGQLRSAFDRKS
jgi:phenylalanyl-tRNA synthetase beta chain